MANWLRTLRPDGMVLSVDGFWFANEGVGYSDVGAEYLPALTNIKAGATPYFIVAGP